MATTEIKDTQIYPGSSNQILGVNNAGTLDEYKTLSGTSNEISVTHGVGTITLSTPQAIGTGSSPTFAGLTIGSSSGALSASSGVVSVGTLSIFNGGTNSSTALNNNRVMISSSGSIIENSALVVSGNMATDSNGLPTGTLTNAGVFTLGQSNIILNGGQEIWQRGTTFSATSTNSGGVTSNTWTADGWRMALYTGVTGNLAVTVSREAINIHDGTYSAKVNITTATGTSAMVYGQYVDNAVDYAGYTISASAWVKTTLSNIILGVGTNGNEQQSFPHPGDGNWHLLTISNVLPNPIPLNLLDVYVGFSSGNPAVVGIYYVDSVMMVLGPQSVNYSPRSLGNELLLCQSNSPNQGANQFTAYSTTLYNGICTYGIVGTNTNDNAVAGNLGEAIRGFSAQVSFPTSGDWGDLTSIALTAGDWDVSAVVDCALNGGSITGGLGFGISTNSGNNSTGLINGDNQLYIIAPSSVADSSCSIASYRLSLSSSATVYLKYHASYTGNPVMGGRISARRMR